MHNLLTSTKVGINIAPIKINLFTSIERIGAIS